MQTQNQTQQTNCPNCNYPDESSGYHYKGRYIRGLKCGGCNYVEKSPVKVSELQMTQRCSVKINDSQEYLVIVDRSNPEIPSYKFFVKGNANLNPVEPGKVQRKILVYYSNEEWKRWLKLT